MTTDSARERLARKTQECPCYEAMGHKSATSPVCPECLRAGGHCEKCTTLGCKDGQVPVVPGLLRPCFCRVGHIEADGCATGCTQDRRNCKVCGGTGSMVVDEDRALAVMLDYCAKGQINVYHINESREGIDAPEVWVKKPKFGNFYRAEGKGIEALASAIEQALEVKP